MSVMASVCLVDRCQNQAAREGTPLRASRFYCQIDEKHRSSNSREPLATGGRIHHPLPRNALNMGTRAVRRSSPASHTPKPPDANFLTKSRVWPPRPSQATHQRTANFSGAGFKSSPTAFSSVIAMLWISILCESRLVTRRTGGSRSCRGSDAHAAVVQPIRKRRTQPQKKGTFASSARRSCY
jgi:hypothetical protein